MNIKATNRRRPSAHRGRVVAGLLAGIMTVSVARAGTTNTTGYAESFETYTNGFQISGTNGWGAVGRTDAGLVVTNVVNDWAAPPLPGATHTNVLQLTDEITNTLVSPTGGVVVLDFMALPTVADWTPPEVSSNWQYAFYLNASSNLVLWHYNQAATSNEWTTLSDGPVVTNGAWTRFTMEQDYGHGLFQLRVNNGAWITHAQAWTAPGGSTGGSWFYMAQTNGVTPTNLNGVGLAASLTNYVDDIVLTNRQITWSTNGFTESVTNNGTVTSIVSVGLLYDTFTGSNGDDVVASNKLQVANLPSNLTAVATYSSSTQLTVRLTGAALQHEAINSANLIFTFQNTAFTLGNATDVCRYSNSLSLTFFNRPQLDYSRTDFAEDSIVNDGSIDNSSPLLITLTNALFNGTVGDDFAQQGKVQVVNLPSNLVAVLILTNQTQLSVTLTNKAALNDAVNSLSNLTFTFLAAAFSNVAADTVAGLSRTNLSITFYGPVILPELQYTATTFPEAAANDGSVAGSTLRAVGKTFAGNPGVDFITNGWASVSNVPGGLTMQLVRGSGAYDMTLSFTGHATNHLAINTVSNLAVRFTDSAFNGGGATAVSNSVMTNLVVQFHDPPQLTWNSKTFTEAAANDGSMATTNAVTLSGGATFVSGAYTVGTQFTTSGIPAGLTCAVWYEDSAHVAVALSGHAAAHAAGNNTNFTLQFNNAAFNTVAASNITGSMEAGLQIVYSNQPSLSWDNTTFTEALANDGSIATTNTVTLNGGASFTSGSYTPGNQYSTSGVPAGLSCVVWNQDANHVKVALSGNAVAHALADSTNFTLQFNNAAFNTVAAANITGSATNLAVQFTDPAVLVYSGDTFSELSQGTINNSSPVTITLARDTFTGNVGGDFVAAHKVTVTHLPLGLTAVITKSSDTLLSVQLTGKAYYNDQVNSVTNLTFQFASTAFSNVAAGRVTGSLKSDLKINFIDDTPFAFLVPYVEPFEAYAGGSSITAVTNGWSAEYAGAGEVANTNTVGSWTHAYQGPVPVTTTHTNELYVQADLRSEIHSTPDQLVYLDFSVWPTPMVDTPQVSSAMQFAFYVSTNGEFILWHQNRTGGVTNNVLRVLTNAPALDTNRWLRVTVCQDFSNAMFQVRLNNGTPLTDAQGWTGPGGTTNGSWFHMINTNNFMTGFGIVGVGSGYLDDLTVRTNLDNQMPVVLTVSPTMFNESATIEGAIDNSLSNRIALAGAIGAIFAGNNGVVYDSTQVQVSNLPSGLASVVVRTSPTNLSIGLANQAVSNNARDNVSNLVVNVLDGAFTIGAANIAGAGNIIGTSQTGLLILYNDNYSGSVYMIR